MKIKLDKGDELEILSYIKQRWFKINKRGWFVDI